MGSNDASSDPSDDAPAERGQRLISSGEACLGLDACEPFVACALPISIQP
jgi:hypothetical protein